MSTRAAIIAKLPSGKYLGTTLHYDGYPSHAGSILSKHYTNFHKIIHLLNLGQLSVLGSSLDPAPVVKQFGFDWCANQDFSQLPKDQKHQLIKQALGGEFTKAYHRDRNEPKIGPCSWQTWQQLKFDINDNVSGDGVFTATEFIYLFEENKWWLVSGSTDTEARTKNKWIEVKKLLKEN